MIPPNATPLSQRDRLVLAHLLTEPYPTVTTCRIAAGYASSHTAWQVIERLRVLGLVNDAEGKRGALRATVRAVEMERR